MQFVEKLRPKLETVQAGRLRDVLEYLIAAILLIDCNTVWVTIVPIRYYTDAHLMIWLGVCVLGCAILSGAVFSKKKMSACGVALGAVFVYALVYACAQDVGRPPFLYFAGSIAILLVYYLTCYEGGVPSVLLKYNKLVCIVAAYSTVMWLLCSVWQIIPPTGVVWTSWNETVDMNTPVNSYLGIYFTTQGMRNTSIFTEAPMAALQYSLALLIEVFLAKKADIKKMAILLVAILTTSSTMGYLVAAFAVGCYALLLVAKKGWLRKKSVQIAGLAVLILGAAAAVAILIWKVGTTSGSLRSDDLLAGWKSFCDHPLFGNGYDNLKAIRAHMSEWRSFNVGFSSGLMWILSDGGLWFGLLYSYPVVRAVACGITRRQVKMILFAVSLLVIFLIAVFQYSFLLTFILLFLATFQEEDGRELPSD